MHSSLVVARFLTIVAVLVVPASGYAQEAALAGTVADTTGGVLPGVTVTAVHEASGITFESVTDERGAYRMAVRIGSYRLTAALQGFSTVTRAGVEIAVGQQILANIQLSPSTIQETVTVTAEAPLIEVTTSSMTTNIDQRQMQELPVMGRNWQDLGMLAVGSRVNNVVEIAAVGTGTYQVNVDGQQVTQYIGGQTDGQPRFSRDAIAEFEYVSNRFDATQGRSSGIQINAVTKSGTNTMAGTVSGYFRDDRFNAADFIQGRVLPYSNQQLSTTFGGPIRRDRIHFFANYEFENEPQTFTYSSPYPSFNIDQTGARREHKAGLRLDAQFSPALRASVRGAIWKNFQPFDPRFAGGNTIHPSAAVENTRNSDQILFTVTQVLGNRALNEVKAGYSGFRTSEQSAVTWNNHPAKLTEGVTRGAPIVTLRGYTIGQGDNQVPQRITQGNLSVRDDFSFSFSKGGRHDLRVGGEYIKNSWWLMICRFCAGNIDAQGGPVPANLEALFPVWNDPDTWNLAGLNPIVRRFNQAVGDFTFSVDRHVWATWFQDDWQIGPRLTLNLGVRYDLAQGAWGENQELLPFVRAGRKPDTDNIGPRLGFAYKLTDQTVLRGGFGKYFAEVTDQSAHGTISWANIINVDLLNDGRPDFVTNPYNGPRPTFDQLLPLTCPANGNRPGCIPRSINNNLASPESQYPYSYQSSIGFQHQIGPSMAFEADYVNSFSYYEINGRNINQAFNPVTGANYPFNDISRRPYPDWGTVSMRMTDGKSRYHGLQAGLTKRFSNRWQASATYLLSGEWTFDSYPLHPGCEHPITLTNDGRPDANGVRWRCDVPITLAADLWENDWYLGTAQRHRAVFNGIWQVGYGFQLSGLYFFGDNGKQTPSSGVDVRGTGGTGGRLRADGSVIARNSFDKQSLHRVDIRLQRRFGLGGRASIDGMLEVFNLFNHENYATWTVNESNASYGRPSADRGIAYQPRVLQFGFRASF